MKKNIFETLVGGLVLLFAVLFLLFSYKISGGKQKISNGYKIYAEFTNIEGINPGSDIKISGVKIGSVLDVSLNSVSYKAVLTLNLPKDINIPVDSIFKVSTSGLIGGKFINVKIGADEEFFKDGDKAEFTESTMDLEDLISRFLFNSGDKNEKK